MTRAKRSHGFEFATHAYLFIASVAYLTPFAMIAAYFGQL